jgi:hypothetical protein
MQNALNTYENNLRHPSISNTNNSNASNSNSNSNNNSSGVLPSKILSSSLSFNRKKSLDHMAAAKVDSPSSDLQSNLNEVYISPNSEIRKEAKRASVKILQQQQQQSVEYQQKEKQKQQNEVEQALLNAKEPPPLPQHPPPSQSIDSINKSNNGMIFNFESNRMH